MWCSHRHVAKNEKEKYIVNSSRARCGAGRRESVAQFLVEGHRRRSKVMLLRFNRVLVSLTSGYQVAP